MTHDEHSVGKWIGRTVYVHSSAIGWLPSEYQHLLSKALNNRSSDARHRYNVIKVNKLTRQVSLLRYGLFRTDPFPALLSAITLNLEGGGETHRCYSESANPPILHRKELLLVRNDPDRERFAKLTEQLESLGMYKDSHKIGFRKQWAQRLIVAGLCIKEHRVIECTIQTGSADDEPW